MAAAPHHAAPAAGPDLRRRHHLARLDVQGPSPRRCDSEDRLVRFHFFLIRNHPWELGAQRSAELFQPALDPGSQFPGRVLRQSFQLRAQRLRDTLRQ